MQLNPPEIQVLKQKILHALRCTAANLQNGVSPAEILSEVSSAATAGDISSHARQTVYRALYSIGTDWAPEDLSAVLKDLDTL